MNSTKNDNFAEEILEANRAFSGRIVAEKLPVARSPGSRMVITCMDPRVNVEAIGIRPFEQDGSTTNTVRIVRTIGAMAEPRSLIVGIHLAGIREIIVIMHTDCGCCAAWVKRDALIENLRRNVGAEAFERFAAEVGEPFEQRLMNSLKAFADPRVALSAEVSRIRGFTYVPSDVVVHGLLYDLSTGAVEVIIDGTK